MNLESLVNDVLSDVKRKFRQTHPAREESFTDVVRGFIAAVDWKEPWIIGILATHLLLWLILVLGRNNSTVLGSLFAFAMCIVFNAEWINGRAAAYWDLFAGQPYFDERGVFMSALVSGPLIVLMIAVLVLYLKQTASLMVTVKRRQLAAAAKSRRAQAVTDTQPAQAAEQPAGAAAQAKLRRRQA